MSFDLQGARQAGYTDEEIFEHLAQQNPSFNSPEAIKAGYSVSEINEYLANMQPAKEPEGMVSGAISSVLGMEQGITEALPDPVRAVAETTRGAAEAGASLLTSGVGMAAGGVSALGKLATGSSLEDSIETMNRVAKALTFEPRSDVGKRGVENITNVLEKARDASGRAAEAATGSAAGGRTGGEVAFDIVTNFLPVGAIARSVKRKGKASVELNTKAEDLLAQKKSEEAYAKAMADLDNQMIRYPQDYQAPQLGLGGRVEGIPDGVRGKNAMPPDSSVVRTQEAMDADMMAREQEIRAAQEGPIPFEPEPKVGPMGLEVTGGLEGPIRFPEYTREIPGTEGQRLALTDMERSTGELPGATGMAIPKTREPYQVTLENKNLRAENIINDDVAGRYVRALDEQSQQVENIRNQLRIAEADAMIIKGADYGDNPKAYLATAKKAEKALETKRAELREAVSKANETSRTLDDVIAKLEKRPMSPMVEQRPPTIRELNAIRQKARQLGKSLSSSGLGRGKSQLGAIGDVTQLKFKPRMSLEEAIKTEELNLRNLKQDLQITKDQLTWMENGDISKAALESMKRNKQTPLQVQKEMREVIADTERAILEVEARLDFEKGKLNKPSAPVVSLAERRDLDFTKGPGKSQSGAVDPELLANIATLGVAGMVKKALQKQPKNTPSPKPSKNEGDAKSIADMANSPEEWNTVKQKLDPETPDVDVSWRTLTMQNLSNLSMLTHFAKHPILDWWYNTVKHVNTNNNLLANKLKQGTIFGLRGLTSHTVDPKSPHALWHGMSNKDKDALAAIYTKFGGRFELTDADFRQLGVSQAVANAYKAMTASLKEARAKINEARIASGKSPIADLPGYFPTSRKGDFKVVVKDPSGETIYADIVENRFQARRIEKELRNRFTKEGYSIEASTVKHETAGNPYNVTTVPFEDILDSLKKDDPRVKAIESAMREIQSHRGYFGRHTIQRKFIEGGNITRKNLWETFEHYIDAGLNHKGNLELSRISNEVVNDPDFKAPNVKKLISESTGHLVKASEDNGLVKAIDGIAEAGMTMMTAGQFGRGAARSTVRFLNNYFMYKALFSYRPSFLAASLVQTEAFAPQWIAHHQANGYSKGGILQAMYDGEKTALLAKTSGGKADPMFTAFIKDYMSPRGSIDPTMIHSMDLFGEGGHRARSWLTGHAPLQTIESWGRYRAAAMGYSFFKENGLKGRELFEAAERFTNDVMADYSRVEAPRWIKHSGIAGQALGPLTTFATQYWAMTAMMLKDALKSPNPSNLKPIAIHLAQSAAWGGALGALFVKEVDAVLALLQMLGLRDADSENLSEWLMTTVQDPEGAFAGMSQATKDAALHGTLSAAAGGRNFGASMAAPELRLPGGGDPLKAMPGLALMSEFLTNVKDLLTRGTEADKKKLIKTVLPNMVNSVVEAFEVDMANMSVEPKPEGTILTNSNKRGFGATELTEHQRTSRLMGTKSLDEVRENAANWSDKRRQQIAMKKLQGYVDLAADEITSGSNEQDLGELMEKAMELGMTPDQFERNVMNVIKQRNQTETMRRIGKGSTPRQIQSYEWMERLNPSGQ